MRAKILIVEDHPDYRDLLRMQMEHLGYDVIEARSGEEGIKKAWAENPDLIIMDIGLPGIDRIEATIALKQNLKTSEIPVIAHSEWKKEEYRDGILAAGFVEFLTKPTPTDVLRKVLQRVLEAKAGQKSVLSH
jgi:CheY-like chemotaxis protein